jgi:AraC-like DNA-binding protein
MSINEKIYILPENSSNSEFLPIIAGGISYHTEITKRRKSEITSFEYILKGEGVVNINNLTFYPKTGDICLLHKGTDHTYYSSKKNPWTKIWFAVKGSLVTQLLSIHKLENTYLIKNCPLKHLFEKMRDSIKDTKYNMKHISKKSLLIIYEIIMEIAEFINKKNQPVSDDILTIKNYLDAHVENKLNLKEIGKVIFKSPSQALRIFKKETGTTPYDYFLTRKAEHAKFLLLNTHLSVKEIAYRLNFSSEYHFSKVFKKKVNIAPSYYRKSIT